jgi:dTDP-4-dehydrorhamnose reductase
MPDVVIHAGAITQVDYCEEHEQEAFKVNQDGTCAVVVKCEQLKSFLIFVSTDFVFDGIKGNYTEDDKCGIGIVNWYGQTKWMAENLVKQSETPWAIVRTCLVYGNVLQGNRSNIISWVKENLQQGKKIKVVSDQWRTPTYVEDLAKGILLMIEKKAAGIYHISGEEVMTPYDMAIATADYLQLDKTLIEKVDATVFKQPAKRPAKTGFNITKAKNELGYQPISFKEGLEKMLG